MTTNLNYQMTSNLLPIHQFIQMEKHELTNRIECLINKVAEVCIEYCHSIEGLN